ncbi:hypothetical protein XA68_12414 [Ophiocordyceps unilateralis]|uniref:Up-regulated in Daf-2 domain-containing protein n=1 Tax=Ophiocordyceps unilateralis TaxID=268505 RepID=A0A2A9PES5_OPHUN|nr:hypothetical protein XA68_12414 [Ophiocordyceps unilateralis]
MQITNILCVLLAAVEVSSAAPSPLQRRFDWGTVKRTAKVTIQNNSPDRIKSVSLVHKYSNVYKHRAEWPVIERFKSPDEGNETTVEYNTGPFTTGRDWWLLSFYSDDMKTQFVTDPNNFRGFVDSLEGIGQLTTVSVAGATAGMVGALAGPVTSVAASTAAVVVAKETTDALFNEETTVGFKQHILRADDEGKMTVIVINPDYTVTFYSTGSPSRTVTSRRPAAIEVKNERGDVVDEIKQ